MRRALLVPPSVGQAESLCFLREDPLGLPQGDLPPRCEVDGGSPWQPGALVARIDDIAPKEREEVVGHGRPAVDSGEIGYRAQPAEGGCSAQCFTRAAPCAFGDRPDIPGRHHRSPDTVVLREVEEGQFLLGADVAAMPIGHVEGRVCHERGELDAGVRQLPQAPTVLGRGPYDAAEVLRPMLVEDLVRRFALRRGPSAAPDDVGTPGLAVRPQKALHDGHVHSIRRPVQSTGPDRRSREQGWAIRMPRAARSTSDTGTCHQPATFTRWRQSPLTSAAMLDQPGCGTGWPSSDRGAASC